MSELTPEQEETKGLILFKFMNEWGPKYDRGAKEYGTDLKDLTIEELIVHAYEEVEDLVSYLTTILIKLDEKRKVDGVGTDKNGTPPSTTEN